MELIKLGNRPSKKVKRYNDIKDIVPEFLAFFDENNGKFKGMHDTAYALAHCQVAEDHYAFFIVTADWVKGTETKDAPKDQLFPARVIINPVIVKTPETIKKVVTVINPLTKLPEERERPIKNTYRVEEGCMSFPFRQSKKMERFNTIWVEYQVKGLLGLRTIREKVSGLKAHIFQHECDHLKGYNMFYGNRVK